MKPRWAIQSLFSLSSKNSLQETPNLANMCHVIIVCGQQGNLHLGSSLHAIIIKKNRFFDLENPLNRRNSLFIWNSLVSMYVKRGALEYAAKLFDEMPVRDTVSWNSMISGFSKNGDYESSFGYFSKMYESGVCRLDQATLTSILPVCNGPSWHGVGEMIHSVAFLNGYYNEISVGNALITMYFRCEGFDSGKRVFDEMLARNVITWTAVISGLAQNQFFEESLELFNAMRLGSVEPNILTYLGSLLACSGLQALNVGRKMHGLVWKLGIQSDTCIETALMDMYSKCCSVDDLLSIFGTVGVLDDVSMTVVLMGLAQNGFEEEAIQIFVEMVKQGNKIDADMVSAVLGVFGIDMSLSLGKQIHTLTVKKGMNFTSTFVSNGLMNMYSKCGDLEDSIRVFEQMQHRNSISWNSMIAAFARHGDGLRALELFEKMKLESIEPTEVTFLSLIHACSHVGLVDKGKELFETMSRDYKIDHRMEHYACVVDMLGRAGHIKEAKEFIDKMPIKPDIQVWQALLGACGIYGDSEIGKYAADKLVLESPESTTAYISLANIYSSHARWKERARAIKKIKELGVEKETGTSWIEIEKNVHKFVVEDRMHLQGEKIHDVLLELLRHMKDDGSITDKPIIPYYLNQIRNGYVFECLY